MSHDDGVESFPDLPPRKIDHVFPFERLVPRVLSACARGPTGDPAGQVRMHKREQEDVDPVAQNALEDAIACIVAQQTIAVMEIEPLSIQYAFHGIRADVDAQFLGKESPQPKVMIPGEIRDPDALIADLGQRSEKANVTAGDDGSVFEPEIEQVAEDEHMLRVFGDGLQKSNDAIFPGTVFLTGAKPEMHIGEKVDTCTSFAAICH